MRRRGRAAGGGPDGGCGAAPAPLERARFRAEAFRRDGGRCVLCGAPAEDAHHILDRKLWPDGGNHLGNAASVCGPCHLRCEMTLVSVPDIRRASGIGRPTVPPGMDPGTETDKWGNPVLPDGRRLPGPLFTDDGCRRILARGGVLRLFPPEEGDRGRPGRPAGNDGGERE